MALTIPSEFQSRARIRNSEYVALIHIYYNNTSYYRFATKSCVVDGYQYLGIVDDIGALTENWNVFDENNVSVSVPTITLNDYTTETGYGSLYRFSDVFGEAGIVGNSVDIYVGYIGTALSSYLKIFNGTIENVTISNKIDIECRSNEIPDININGRRLSYKVQTLGDQVVSGILSIPKEADGLYLPVVFGQHWNSPMVCYNAETFVNDVNGIPQLNSSTYWAENDLDYHPNNIIVSGVSRIPSFYQANTGQSGIVVYLYQEGQNTGESKAALDLTDGDLQLDGYVPGYEIGYRGGRNFTKTVYQSIPGIQIHYPNASGSINTDYSWFCNVPLRMYKSGTGSNYFHTSSAVTSSDGESTISNILDGNENTKWSFTSSGVVGGAVRVVVDVPLEQNLRVDEKLAVQKNRPIYTPEKQLTNDDYNMLMLGRTSVKPGATKTLNGYMWISNLFYAFLGSTPPASNPSFGFSSNNPSGYYNFIGATFFGRNANIHTYVSGHQHGYNYLSYPFITNLNSSGHLIDFANDEIGYDETNSSFESFVGDAGNMLSFSPSWMGTYPFLQRKVLSKDLKGLMIFALAYSGLLTEDIHNVYWEAVEKVDYDLGGYLYTYTSGLTVDNADLVMLSHDDSGDVNGYMLKRPNEYLEMIYQAKISGGLTESNYNYNEWALSDDDWEEVYGTVRDRSGFALVEETTASQFIKDYCKDELWTSYRDNLGKFRFVIIPKDPLTIVLNSTTIDYRDLDNFKTFYSPLQNLCAEIKSLKTDYVYANDTYVNDSAWKIIEAEDYNWSYWKRDNSYTKNGLIRDSIDKKYTSFTNPSIVSYSGVYYTCQLSHTSGSSYSPHSKYDPSYDGGRYWVRCTSGLVPTSATAWTPSTKYYGYDAEAEVIASLYINQWANLHRMVEITTKVLTYFTLEVGDIVEFTNMPGKWLGLDIKGWNGNTTTSGIVVNAQTVTHKGIVTAINRTTDGIKATIMQLHVLNDLRVGRTK